MNVSYLKKITRLALTCLDEAVLDVLYKANRELQPGEISAFLGIPADSQRLVENANPIVRGILARLEYDGLVQQKEKYGGWTLTTKGFQTQTVRGESV